MSLAFAEMVEDSPWTDQVAGKPCQWLRPGTKAKDILKLSVALGILVDRSRLLDEQAAQERQEGKASRGSERIIDDLARLLRGARPRAGLNSNIQSFGSP